MASSAKPNTSRNQSAAAATPEQGNGQGTPDKSVVEEMKQQHRQIEALLTNPDDSGDPAELVKQVGAAWIPHTIIEEEILVPALQQAGVDPGVLAEADVRRDIVKLLLADLRENPTGEAVAAKLNVLGNEIDALIEAEERDDTGLFAQAQSKGVDLEALRPQISARMAAIQSDTEGESSNALEPNSLRLRGSRRQQEEFSTMPNSNMRERDENGRFRSDDDDRRGGYRDRDERGRFASDERDYRSRSSRDYDDDYRRSGSNGGGPGRDENGRFTSSGYDDDRRRYYDDDRDRRSSRDYDDDRRGGRDEGRGWHGDPEGHSEASRRGWESREGARYSSRSDRDRDYDDDRRGGERGEGRGWYGDSRGHAEAAHLGWERRDDEERYSSRDRDYDDDRRYRERDENGRFASGNRGYSRSSRDDDDDRRGHGGWFGDSRGHAEAARRGWEDRR